MAGIYVHIPFCLSKCPYCGFYSEGGHERIPRSYLEALAVDAAREACHWNGYRFESIYIGGGTPSLLSAHDLEKLLDLLSNSFCLNDNPEITIEANPATLNQVQLRQYVKVGIGRISVGVQSLVSAELGSLGRQHSPAQAVALLNWAREAGIDSISADVIVGIPDQTHETLAWSLTMILSRIDHISCYMLSIDEGTSLYLDVRLGRVALPSERHLVALYRWAARLIEDSGFEHYEISNWCRPGHACRHNQNYWSRGEYLGLGAGAHSHRKNRRYMKVKDWRRYVDSVLRHSSPIARVEHLSPEQVLLEELMLRLRTSRGINIKWLEELTPDGRCSHLIDDLVTSGLLVKTDENISLSPRGMLLERAITEKLAAQLSISQPLLR